MDQKAGYLLATTGVLSAALGIPIGKLLSLTPDPDYDWQVKLQRIGVVLTIIFFGLALKAIIPIIQVLTTHYDPIRPNTKAPGMSFPLVLLKRYNRDEDKYLHTLSITTGNDLLHEYANLITEVAVIYDIKHYKLASACYWLVSAAVAWFITVSATVYLILFM